MGKIYGKIHADKNFEQKKKKSLKRQGKGFVTIVVTPNTKLKKHMQSSDLLDGIHVANSAVNDHIFPSMTHLRQDCICYPLPYLIWYKKQLKD